MDVLNYHAAVNALGYHWTTTARSSGQKRRESANEKTELNFLEDPDPCVEGIEKGTAGGQFRKFDPLKEAPGMFLDFAFLNKDDPYLTADAIITFCNRYGTLGLDSPPARVASEPYSGWVRQIDILRHAVDVWESIRLENLDILKVLADWDGKPLSQTHLELLDADREENGRAGLPFNLREWVIDTAAGTRLEELNQGSLGWAARKYIAWITDQNLPKYIKVHFAEKSFDPNDTRPFEIRYVPQNLLGCIWLQFADYLSHPREFRQCDICNRWTLSGGAERVRSTRKYCSDQCRNISHYKKATVIGLHKSGKSIKKIKDETGIRKEVVRLWTKANAPNRGGR